MKILLEVDVCEHHDSVNITVEESGAYWYQSGWISERKCDEPDCLKVCTVRVIKTPDGVGELLGRGRVHQPREGTQEKALEGHPLSCAPPPCQAPPGGSGDAPPPKPPLKPMRRARPPKGREAL